MHGEHRRLQQVMRITPSWSGWFGALTMLVEGAGVYGGV